MQKTAENQETPQQFRRTQLLFGKEAMDKLRASRVIIFGVGGVGSYAAEALARSGVGAIDLVDHDKVSITNINRQLEATLETIGQSKVEAMANRIASINPACVVTQHQCFFLPSTGASFDFSKYDYVIDAVDTVTGKLLIIEEATRASVPVISSMGAAYKLDPTQFRVADIYETTIDPLAKIIRKECRKRGIEQLKVVYSVEAPTMLPESFAAAESNEIDAASEESSRHGVPGSCAFVPSAVGLIIASAVVRDLAL